MLHELRVENLLLLERAELRFSGGLNVLTGETGAGKTLLAHALDLLLGGRARQGIVRRGAAEAYVEGVFTLPDELREREVVPDGAEEIVLARRVWPDGRTRAYVCGRSATVGDLRDLGNRLVAFYGQHEHRRLMLGTAQLDVLDAHGGADQLGLRAEVGTAYERVRQLQARVEELREVAGARERELDLLAFELGEIEAANPSQEEAAMLTLERERVQHVEALLQAATLAAEAMAPDSDAGALQQLAKATHQLDPLRSVDPVLGRLAERVEALRYEAEDLGRELRSYAHELSAGSAAEAEAPDPAARLEEIEERLALFARLVRKHGGSIAEVLAHGERCRARISELQSAEVALEGAHGELAEAESRLAELAEALTQARRRAAPSLAEAVGVRLTELAMPEAQFEIALEPRPEGCGARGADAVELMISTNAGIPLGPLREIASGGELSRVMLALLSVAHAPGAEVRGADGPLLVFDEIDAGIGGHTARAVGEHLRELAQGRQVLCITHLPQVAALATSHFTIAKEASTVPATTTVTALEPGAVVRELVRMLGAAEGDRAARQHARQLLRHAA